jgi:hypothetical protein
MDRVSGGCFVTPKSVADAMAPFSVRQRIRLFSALSGADRVKILLSLFRDRDISVELPRRTSSRSSEYYHLLLISNKRKVLALRNQDYTRTRSKFCLRRQDGAPRVSAMRRLSADVG